MPKTIDRNTASKKATKSKLTTTFLSKLPPRKPIAASESSDPTTVNTLRTRLALTQAQFARLLAVSVRSLATLESGMAPTEPVFRRFTELERLTSGLSEVIKKESLGKWLQTPNPAFDGLKPIEVIERGESDRLWEMIYLLRSGVPS